MDDSATFSDLESEQEALSKTEMIFEQGGVSQKFTTNDKRRKVLIPGKLYFTENKYGEYIEWKADETVCVETPQHQSVSPDSSKDWSVSSGIGFHVGQEDSIEFLPDLRLSEYRRPIKLELAEVRSYLLPSRSKGREVIFNLADGTIQNPLIFDRGSPEGLISTLKRYVTIKPSKYERDLYMLTPKKIEAPITPMSHLAGLFPEQAAHVNQVFQFVSDIRNDPKAVAFTALAKIADYALTPSQTTDRAGSRNSRSKSPSPTHTHAGNNGKNSNVNGSSPMNGSTTFNNVSSFLDPDYLTNEEGYEVIFKPGKPKIELGERPKTFRGQPLSQEQWLNYLDHEGRVMNFDEIKQIVFLGGVEPSIRKHVWVFLLGVYSNNSTYIERKEIHKDNTCSYLRMKNQWASITDDQEERFHAFRDFKSLIEKDVMRTDRTLDYFREDNNRGSELLRNILMTYVMYNFNLGYVQGMSDILAPILMEIQDEVLSFWLFVKFMDRIWTNFEMSQEGMQRQLRESYTILQLIDPRFSAYLDACDASNMYFAFRWLLILFKREFSAIDNLILWETLWTELPGPSFQLFIGLAILEEHRTTIMANRYGLSEILRHINDLSLRIDLCETLIRAEAIYQQILKVEDKLPNNIRIIIGLQEKPEPSPSLETGSGSSISPEPLECLSAGGADGFISSTSTSSIIRSTGPTVEEQSLELQCDMGISQFM